MELIIQEQDNVTIISVSGSIDALTATELTDFADAQIEAGHTKLVIDLSQVEFMSSAGLRSFLGTMKNCRKGGGDLLLASTQPGVEKVLKMSGFTEIIKMYPSLEDAAAEFKD